MLNEAETRAEHIDPALKAAGWGVVDGSRVLREVQITKGRLQGGGKRAKPEIADYVLVYRNLKLLVDEGAVQMVTLPGDSPRYESAGHAHHHHFQCEACARVFDVHACPGDLSSMAPAGFQVSHHELTLYGLCADCRQSTVARIG